MNETSLSLLGLLKANDDRGWAGFVKSYSPVITRWLNALGAKNHDDISQEVLQAVFMSIKNFDHQRDGSFRRWLRTIVRHRVLASNRKNRKRDLPQLTQSYLEQLAEDASASSRLWDEEHARFILQQALARAREDYADDNAYQAFVRYAIDGRPPNDVAQELGVRVGYVYLARHRFKKILRGYVDDLLA